MQPQVHRLDPLIVHHLPPAPAFTGRDEELRQMRDFWFGGPGVLSLIGLGGAGKTALAQRFVSWLLQNDPPDGLLVWSFYDDPDANLFLKTAHGYITGGKEAQASGAGWFHLLNEALSEGQRFLLVLDGLERVQRQQTDASGIYGELEDPLLRGFLFRIAAGAGNAKAIITSRFPVSSVERWLGKGYQVVNVDYLSPEAARALFRSNKVQGSDAEIDEVVRRYGGHALTLDLLACGLTKFSQGSLAAAPEVPEAPDEKAAQSQRLAAVLRYFQENLTPRQVELLSRLCVFRFGVDLDSLTSIFLSGDTDAVAGALAGAGKEELEADIRELIQLHMVGQEQQGKYTVHPAIRDYFYRLFRDPAQMHQAVQEHLIPLSERPGIGLPTDKESLDMLEELVYHAMHAGGVREAAEIYMSRMGGGDHLNTRLGEYIRTYRVLSAFPACPDATGMYHCLRAFGRFEEALEWRPSNRYILLAAGQLERLSNDPEDATRAVARFLQGAEVRLPDRMPDSPIPVAALYLYREDLIEAERLAELEIRNSLYVDDQVRNELVLADVQRRRGMVPVASATLERTSTWVLNSGSQEHLCLMHLVRGRILRSSTRKAGAIEALEEGILTARECGFNLWLADLLNERASLAIDMKKPADARAAAEEALVVSDAPECRFAFGKKSAEKALAALSK